MPRGALRSLASVLALGAACSKTGPARIDEPAFFQRAIPAAGTLTAVAIGGEPYSRKLLAVSLQGVVNQKEVRLFVLDALPGTVPSIGAPGPASTQAFWLERYGGKANDAVDLDRALERFGREAAGYILASEREPWTIDAATTLAGISRTLVATSSEAPALDALHLARLDDLRGRWPSNQACIEDTFARLYPQTNALALAAETPKDYRLRDFIIQNRLFTFHARPDADGWKAVEDVLARTPSNQPVFGYLASTPVEEFISVRTISMAGKFLIPCDTTTNLSVHTAMRTPLPTPRPVQGTDCRQGSFRAVVGISDGDNLSIAIELYPSDHNWLFEQAPSRLPIGWSLSPALARLAPGVAAYYASTRRPSDELVGMLGIGYAHPTAFPDPRTFLEESFTALQRLGMTALWQLDVFLDFDHQNAAWTPIAAAYDAGRIRGMLLGYAGGGRRAPIRIGAMPVLLAENRYEDSPSDIARQIQAAYEAWRAGGPDLVFMSASIWMNDYAGLEAALSELASRPDVVFLTPSQALACL